MVNDIRDFVFACPYCGQVVDYWHNGQDCPVDRPFINVYNGRATLVKMVNTDSGGFLLAPYEPQPPHEMLERAVLEAGGALNISGHYPLSKEVGDWLAQERR